MGSRPGIGGSGARRLYTNFDEVRTNLRRPTILNGIDDLANRQDLIDRVLAITLPAIAPEQRQSDARLLRNSERARPAMVGALLTILSRSLQKLPMTFLPQAPRMADFARFSTAAEEPLGWPPGAFMQAFDYNRQAALQTAVESSVVAPVVLTFMENRTEWTGTATDLLHLLNRLMETPRGPRGWPRTPAQLGDQMRRVAPALRNCGVDVTFRRSTQRVRTRLIHLTRTEDFAAYGMSGAPSNGRGAGFSLS